MILFTKEDLIDTVHGDVLTMGKVNTKADIERVIVSTFEKIQKALERGETVLLPIGRLSVRQRKATKARNPRTGHMLDIPARNNIRFSASKKFKERVNQKASV